MMRISDLDSGNVECPTCAGEGWVCENHPDRSWPSVCDCGAGMPCQCNPLSYAFRARITQSTFPMWPPQNKKPTPTAI